MSDHQIAAPVAACVLAVLHLFGSALRFLTLVPRSRWLSAAGGVSVAYVFAHLLPELAEGQAAIEGEAGRGGEEAAAGPMLEFLEHHVYLAALVGLGIFWGVRKHSLTSRRRRKQQAADDQTADAAFWLSVTSSAVHNAGIGYLLLRSSSPQPARAEKRALDVRYHGRYHHRAVAMTLRLTDEETEALRLRARREGRSMQEVAREAVREYVQRTSHRELLDEVLDEELPRYAEALKRLGE